MARRIDIVQVEAALKRAARNARTGPAAVRAGRFVATTSKTAASSALTQRRTKKQKGK
jgi:hypothetical protein